jgi:DNA-binding transcriptional LysR family regulator
VTRPAISQAILRLEDWAGVKLMTHEKKVFRLTSTGESFYRDAKAAFQQMNDTFSGKGRASGEVRIGCSASLAESFLVPALRAQKDLQAVGIHIGSSMQVRQLLKEGSIRIGVVIDDLVEPMLHREVIHKGQFVFAGKSAEFSNLLVTTESRPEVIGAKKYLMKRKIDFSRQMQVGSWSVAQSLAKSLGGTCLIPEFLIQNPMRKISVTGFKFSYEVSVLHRGTHSLGRSEVQFLEDLRKMKRAAD